jgi:hypothetical protein
MSDEAGRAEAPRGKSLDDIAAMMAENTVRMRETRAAARPQPTPPKPVPTAQTVPNKVADAEEDVEIDDDTDTPAKDDTAVDESGVEDQDVPDQPEAPYEDDADESGSDGEFEVDDDTEFQLDDDTKVSFKNLKQLYTAEKDKLELIETQRTATQEALVERQKALQDSERARNAAVAVFEHFDRLIATPLFSKPDESLKKNNPAEYIQRLDYYTQDQERIRQQKADLSEAFNKHLETEKELVNNLKRQTIQKLTEVIPALRSSDPAQKERASKDILEAASHYGFKDEEVNEARDYRLYQMAYDAQQYRKLMTQSKQGTQETKEDKTTKVRNQTRTLRPRGTTAQNRLTAKAKLVKTAKAAAQKSGKVDDVADFIAAKKRV